MTKEEWYKLEIGDTLIALHGSIFKHIFQESELLICKSTKESLNLSIQITPLNQPLTELEHPNLYTLSFYKDYVLSHKKSFYSSNNRFNKIEE